MLHLVQKEKNEILYSQKYLQVIVDIYYLRLVRTAFTQRIPTLFL